MTNDIVPGPGFGRTVDPPSGGGDDGQMELTMRVARLEEDMKEVKAALVRIEPLLGRVDERLKAMPSAADVGEIKGRLGGLPTWWQLLAANLLWRSRFPASCSR